MSLVDESSVVHGSILDVLMSGITVQPELCGDSTG